MSSHVESSEIKEYSVLGHLKSFKIFQVSLENRIFGFWPF